MLDQIIIPTTASLVCSRFQQSTRPSFLPSSSLLFSSLLFSPTTHNQLHTTNYAQPTTQNQLHTSNYTEPTAHNPLYRTDHTQPTTHNRLHTTDYTQPTSHNRLLLIHPNCLETKSSPPFTSVFIGEYGFPQGRCKFYRGNTDVHKGGGKASTDCSM